MKRSTKDDAIDWFGALEAATAEARGVRPGPTLGPVARCLCGSSDTRDHPIFTPVDLTDVTDDLTVQCTEAIERCKACGHGIHRGAMCVRRHFGPTTTVRDHFHPECVRL